MTFLHGAACTVFSFGPPLAIYKGTGLSDQSGTTWLLSLASIFYFLNLFAKTCESLDRVHAKPQGSQLEAVVLRLFFSGGVSELAGGQLSSRRDMRELGYLQREGPLRPQDLNPPAHKGRHTSLSFALTRVERIHAGVSLRLEGEGASTESSYWILYLSAACLVHMASKRRLTRASQIGFFVFAGLLVPGTLCQKHMLGLVEPPQRFLSDAVTPLCWAALGLQGAMALSAGAACYMAFTTRQQQAHAHKLD
ncbi:hypothetical protein Emag_005974 [Eimeria magna]